MVGGGEELTQQCGVELRPAESTEIPEIRLGKVGNIKR